FGHVRNDKMLVDLYSAADVTVLPSLQEAFGQMATESMACGTPVVAFDGTGLTDIVEHKKNGYLASRADITDLAIGINWVLTNGERHEILAANARSTAVEQFDIRKVARRFIDLYKRSVVST
ncbi:MAG: glycosyltransferase, partial [Bacteroidia bacterium]|nr:glycosyltransferase [Bacteroidia bacterium]